MRIDPTNWNSFTGAAIAVIVTVLTAFLAAVMGAKSGEIAGALGGLLGGIIGAGAAVIAVRQTLIGQRNEEILKVASAVQTEVRGYLKHVIGAIRICESVVRGTRVIPRTDAGYIGKNLSQPIIYSAVADRVGLLPHPHQTVEFYMRMQEAKARIDALAAATVGDANVTADIAKAVIESLLIALQVARPILAEQERIVGNPQMAEVVRDRSLSQLDRCIQSVHAWFPEAQAFQGPEF